MKQHLVTVVDDIDSDFLKNFGTIEHVAKLRNLVVFHHSSQESVDFLKQDSRVVSIRESDTFSLTEDEMFYDELARSYEENAEFDKQMAEDLMTVSWEVDQMDDDWLAVYAQELDELGVVPAKKIETVKANIADITKGSPMLIVE